MTARDEPRGCGAAAGGDLPALAAFGDALVAAARRDELPSIEAFGERLVARAREPRRRRWRSVAVAFAVMVPVAATSGAATAVVLRQTVVEAPVPEQVPDEQTPLAGTAVVTPLRAPDPDGGPPWALRVARSKTGFTCTTVGQVRDNVFGLTGLDGVFRRLPGELSDACGQGGTLTGARVMAADELRDVRSVVYGVAGERLRSVTLRTATGDRKLRVGPGGTYVTVLRGYPEDHQLSLSLAFAGGRAERHNLGDARPTITDPAGAQAWETMRYAMGTRWRCAFVQQARGSGPARVKTPTACLGLRTSTRAWVADARTIRPGQQGVKGFDQWTWQDTPARTVVYGVARSNDAVRKVVLHGAGPPQALDVSKQGAFAAVLAPSVKPDGLTLEVTLADGTVERGRPGEGLVPDPVESRRPR
ncbi:hypothetical protein DVA67_018265 [Solirubrobacter sp. CPCC 204708]|uniref:MucB/RseB N-terminal domain-containing protein n=1 Tax=Solirubrobacter deserti TaxID=2282478 RepID=A0ABT4RUX5_9ACTN|nr:hypothetical protein [Solirubrobacter deserti]MBE2317932.1 hypothetical protein [Solirubrobacter deserti]MDA0142280.1 hypothetical protein [Solirubrobacter deserti]